MGTDRTAKVRSCKNAGTDKLHAKRAVVEGVPGPRCATCAREWKRATSLKNRQRRIATNFGLPPDVYDAILAAQGGACAICQRSTGVTAMRKGRRRLAVDHSHKCCSGPTSCGQCVRGLLCMGCNSALAHFRDDPEAGTRLAAYLRRPPAQSVLLAQDDAEPGRSLTA